MFRVILYRNQMSEGQDDSDQALEGHRRSIGETSEKNRDVIGEASEKHRRNIGEKPRRHRRSIRETSEKNQDVIGETSEKYWKEFRADLNDTQISILELLSVDAYLSAAKMARQLGIASRNVEANIKKLKEKGMVVRHGSPKGGYWEVR